LRIRGLVQGVGFRPTVWHVARDLGLKGDVRNDGDGVWVRLLADERQADAFMRELRDRLPPLARIDAFEQCPLDEDFQPSDFSIHHSDQTTPLTGIVPDAATCPACVAELNDPNNRRYRYPFINCTHCGPRLSIIRAIPYDRPNTSMDAFPMCPTCEAEYTDPADRRYHAQPNACADCGPRVWIEGYASAEPFELAAETLRKGGILAIKGIGGFHLACDAHNAEAVDTLRQRKRRYGKPFALMARDLDVIRRYVHMDGSDQELLQSPAAPIVLMGRRADASQVLPKGIALDHETLGFMLPYSPIHHLLLQGWDTPLVMTSGNLSDEPQCTDNSEAANRLSDIADRVLMHDRVIVNRVDDSVIRPMAGKPRFYRRARGYAPAPILVHESFKDCPPVLALGAELKSTICLLSQARATVSQHLGDLEDARTSDEFERTTALYQHIFAFKPQAIVVDLHPDYRSSRHGENLATTDGRELIRVQHHHAHIASVMAENGLPMDANPVLGIALDGLGYGTDGTIWGGEFLKANFSDFKRLGHLVNTPMPGGTQAILEPWRDLWAQLHARGLWDDTAASHAHLPIIQFLQSKPLPVLENMLKRGLNSPLTSSAGRLFDAVAATLQLHHERVHQEGQAAIALEQLASQADDSAGAYPLALCEADHGLELDTQPLWPALFEDLSRGTPAPIIARHFHQGFGQSIMQCALTLCGHEALESVALSGGVFQNRILLEQVVSGLEKAGLEVLHHEHLPSNDGGISLGQAAIGARHLADRS
ncbi:MAG: carbamoyltransferase HypF, partial [Gammaproteobacteria bacterium]